MVNFDMTESKPEPKQDPRDIVITVLVAMLLSPFSGMVRALAFRLLWGWFLAPQYGDGPTLRAWFGVSILITLLTYRLDSTSGKSSVSSVITNTFVHFFMLGSIIVAATMARFVWGWG
jgi:hypothetical protein